MLVISRESPRLPLRWSRHLQLPILLSIAAAGCSRSEGAEWTFADLLRALIGLALTAAIFLLPTLIIVPIIIESERRKRERRTRQSPDPPH